MSVAIDKKTSRLWSRLGPRPVYGQAVNSIAGQNPNIFVVSADLGRSSGLDPFAKQCPGRFANVGIAEQNMIGFCAGMTRVGFNVFASTFAPFASMRAAEQVRMNLGYMQEGVKLVALGSGLAMGFLGNSHFGLEDLAIIQAIPDIDIVCPADCVEIYKTIETLANSDRPTYVRLTGTANNPVCYEDDYKFEIGKGVWVKNPGEFNIISHGSTVGRCKEVINNFSLHNGTEVGLLNLHTIRPLDIEALEIAFSYGKRVIVVEEHFEYGGLGQSILNYMHRQNIEPSRLVLHGIKNKFVATGSYEYMLAQQSLDVSGIKRRVADLLPKTRK